MSTSQHRHTEHKAGSREWGGGFYAHPPAADPREAALLEPHTNGSSRAGVTGPCCHPDRLGGRFLAPWPHRGDRSGRSPSFHKGEGQVREARGPAGKLRPSLQNRRRQKHREARVFRFFTSVLRTMRQNNDHLRLRGFLKKRRFPLSRKSLASGDLGSSELWAGDPVGGAAGTSGGRGRGPR